ncbi:MAG: hypothetical protein LLF83_09740 [Methanobacterium sp.]|nr:hypothetical protein [Methanobacterium sp.]
MREKIVENVLFIIAGVIVLLAVELKFIHLNEIIMIVLGFVGFAALLNGAYGLYNTLSS